MRPSTRSLTPYLPIYGHGLYGIEMTKVHDLHAKWRRDPEYREAYDALGPEFELARALIEARTSAGLTQAQLAERMKDGAVSRREAGKRAV